jgi:hypothetical protein
MTTNPFSTELSWGGFPVACEHVRARRQFGGINHGVPGGSGEIGDLNVIQTDFDF